jgi:hypothetical protein
MADPGDWKGYPPSYFRSNYRADVLASRYVTATANSGVEPDRPYVVCGLVFRIAAGFRAFGGLG